MAYHYTESGLDNVWIENGYTIHKTPYGEGVSIEDTEGLHRAIGLWLINVAEPLDGSELRFIRLEMELTQKDLGGILGVDEQSVRRWEKKSDATFNGAADRLLRVLYSEYLQGNGSVRRMVDRLATLNQVEVGEIYFCETQEGWKPRDLVA